MTESNLVKKWLKEASMRRLSLYIKNKTEQVGNAMIFDTTISLPGDDLEKSGLSSIEIFHLERWVAGIETGRQCMLAILDYRLSQKNDDQKRTVQTSDDFQPMELVKSMINLPNDFLCDSGYLYTTIFQRPPTSVTKEALQLVVQKAFEKTPSSLGIEQINLAIKQLRIDSLVVGFDDSMGTKSEENEKIEESIKVSGTIEEEYFRLQIFIELIRMHIVYCNKKNELAKTSLFDISSGTNEYQNNILPSNNIEDCDIYLSGTSFLSNPVSAKLDIDAIEQHLRTPLEKVVEQAEKMSPDDLEGVNNLLKPYLKQLAGLKSILSDQLKDLQESKSFLALGLSSDASDEAIKKAYRALAIKLHPDKPGGDTQKFQQLQDAYQEVIKKKKHDQAEKEARNEMKPQKKKENNVKKNQYESKKSQTQENDNNDTCNDENMHNKDITDNNDNHIDESKDIQSSEDRTSNKNAELFESAEVDSITDEDIIAIDKEINEEDNDNVHHTTDNNEDDTDNNDEEDDDLDALMDRMKNISIDEDDEDEDNLNIPIFGNTNKIYENDNEHAQDIVNQISDLLQRIKGAAGEITQLAQLNIKWQKMIEKAMELPYSLKEVYKILTASTGVRSVLKRVKDKQMLPISNMEACALHQAIGPIESMCEWTQQISALAMELPNNCGKEYACAAAGNKTFIHSVERSMHLSLGALKTVISLINTQEQLASCVRRIKDSIKLAAENPEIQSLLLEMVRTGIKSNVITMTNAVDRVIETTMAASDVRDATVQLMRDVDIHIKAEIKRKASENESKEMEEDYSEEDKEALRKCREDRREEDRKNMQQRSASNKDSNKDDSGSGSDENKNSHTESNSLDELKDKIRVLQMQLKIQHIQALQTLNSEVVILQAQIFKELKALPFITSPESIFSNNLHHKRSSSCTKEKESIADFKVSLLTLLADIVDSTCNALKLEFAKPPYLTNSVATNSNIFLARRSLIEKHLSWMFIVLADGSCAKVALHSFFVALTVSNISTGEDVNEELSDNNTTNVSLKLALLPDYRAKCLYLASMVDIAAVHAILGIELQQRIEELLFEGKLSTSTMTYSVTKELYTQQQSAVSQSDGTISESHTDHHPIVIDDLDIEQISISIDNNVVGDDIKNLSSTCIYDIDEDIYEYPMQSSETLTKLDSPNIDKYRDYPQTTLSSFVENKLKQQQHTLTAASTQSIENENMKPNVCNYAM